MKTKNTNKILLLALSICILTPLTNDIFIPALPRMEQEFLSSSVRYLIPIFMLGLSLGQLIIGPILDRFGRKPVFITGILLFTLSSGIISFTSNLHIILSFRFIQALGCAVTIPGVMAIIRDSYAHEKLVHMISRIMGVIVITPVIAPLVGSYLTLLFSWRANFIFILFFGLLYLLIYSCIFKETIQQKNNNALNLKNLIKNYSMLFTTPSYIKYVLCAAFSYGVLFAYVIAAPFLLIKELKVPIALFGWYFAIFAIILAVVSFLIPTINRKFTLVKMMLFGGIVLFLGSISLILVNLIFKESLWTILIPMSIISVGLGFIRPTAATLAMQVFSKNYAGISSAMFNFVSFMMGVLSTSVLSHIVITSLNFSLQITIMSFIAMLISIIAIKQPSK